MIDIIFADDQELFRTGAAEILSDEIDVRIVAQPVSTEQLLSALETLTPHILVLSTSFLPEFSKIERLMKRGHTVLLMLAEEDDHTAYVRWLRARGVVHRSMDRPVLIDALRRVARGELFMQSRSSAMRMDPSEVA